MTDDESSDTQTPVSEETESRSQISDGAHINLPLGEAHTSAEASAITSRQRTQLVMVAGAVRSGKTTLLASLFHRFQKGPFAGLLFAGSTTLPDLDRRCHLARTSSRRTTPDTGRTRPGVPRKLLHLRLRVEDLTEGIVDVLFTDLSGEDYEAARNSPEECRGMRLIHQSDHFVLLLDGKMLTYPTKRQAAKHEAVTLLRCCVESGQLGAHSLVDVLVNKWDAVHVDDQSKRQQNIEFVEDVEQLIRDRFSKNLGRLRFFRIAARPEFPGFQLCHGLEDPLRSWTFDRPESLLERTVRITEPPLSSEFERFMQRKIPSMFADEGK